MSSGKKGKKKKCKTVDLMSFLADGGPVPPIPLKSTSWADDVEDEHEGFSSRSSKEPVILPTAPRAARGPGADDQVIPTSPPYVAYISNLPYDVDEDDLTEFFAGMKVSNMRLPKDYIKIRGYGYVEFEDRQSLIDALNMTNTTIKTRRIRIEVSNSSSDDRMGGRMGRDNRRDNYDDPDRTSGDWRSGPREDLSSSDRGRYDNSERRDHRENSDYDNKPGAWRERDGNERGRTAFRDRGGGGGGFRDDDKDREWSRYDRGSRDRDGDRGSFGPRRNYGGERDTERDWTRKPASANPPDAKQEPRTRPKLQLQPRTKPIEPIAVKEDPEEMSESAELPEETSAEKPAVTEMPEKPAEKPEKPAEKPEKLAEKSEKPAEKPEKPSPPAAAAAPVPAANIFGAAKPVDTAAREREIEERLARSYAESKSKADAEPDKRPSKEGTWGRRNGEGREDKDRERSRPTWRSEEDRGRRVERSAPRSQPQRNNEQQGDSARSGPPASKPAQRSAEPRGQSDSRDRKEKHKDVEISRMPKAKDEQAPNFVASNKYSMLPDDVDSDDIDD